MINKVLFIGSKQFGLDTLILLRQLSPGLITKVLTCDDHNDLRSRKDQFFSYAEQHGLDLLYSDSKLLTHEIIQSYEPDLCFVSGWYQLFLEQTLIIPKFGFIGIHHSLLPKYRGGAPLVWQIINNEKVLGSSIFYLDNGTDSGDIIFQTSIDNNELYIDTARRLLEEKILKGLELLWPKIITNTHTRRQQEHENATYSAQLLKDDGRVNWNEQPERILARIRAQSLPYPCAYSYYNDERVKFVSAKIFDGIFYGLPGQLVTFQKSSGNPIISCGNGKAIVIEKILMDDGQIVDAQKILSSLKIRLS